MNQDLIEIEKHLIQIPGNTASGSLKLQDSKSAKRPMH
jgi:hypothetical protein